MASRYSPRRMEIESLVGLLVEEHRAMHQGLLRARDAARAGAFEDAALALKAVDPIFRQHIADEESQILGLLVGKLGVKGAEDEVRIFRQHRPIHELMTRVAELAALSSSELEARQEELEKLFDEHTSLEETRVFPRARSLSGDGRSS